MLALLRGERLRVRVGLEWNLTALADVLDGERVVDPRTFEGVKGGEPGATASEVRGRGDLLLHRRHRVVELFRELGRPDGRAGLGRFVVEGRTLVGRAIETGLPVLCVVGRTASRAADELLDGACAGGIRCWRASDGLLGTMTPTRPLPDVLAAVQLRVRDASDMCVGEAATLVAAEGLQNPDNLGMLLRTADAAGVEAVVVSADGVDPLHRNAVRAARGAVGRLPIFRCDDLPLWISTLRARGFRVVATTTRGSLGLFESQLVPPMARMVGGAVTAIRRGSHPPIRACRRVPGGRRWPLSRAPQILRRRQMVTFRRNDGPWARSVAWPARDNRPRGRGEDDRKR